MGNSRQIRGYSNRGFFNIYEVMKQEKKTQEKFDEHAMNALEDNRDVIISLIKCAPYLEYFAWDIVYPEGIWE